MSDNDPSVAPTQFGPMVILGMSLFRKYAVQFDLSGDLADPFFVDNHTADNPQRYLHFAEAAPDCKGSAKGTRFLRKAPLQTINLDKVRLSPLQHRLLGARKSIGVPRPLNLGKEFR